MSSVVTELEMNGQYGTAHVCGSVLRSVMAFGGEGLPVSGITPLWLKAYEGYLLHKGGKGLAWNTVSTYMRMLQAVYNRAVARKLAAFIPHQFRDVFTGRKADHRRVLERDDMQKLLVEREPDITSPGMAWARACLELMFRFHGMPFVAGRRVCRYPPVWTAVPCNCWNATGTGTTLHPTCFVFWTGTWRVWPLTGITNGYCACLTADCVRLPCGRRYKAK